MPIQNGKYINPGWNNGAPPAIDSTELNAISDTLEKLDAGGGTGGGGDGKRYARFVIGTSTAGWTAADCDYLCDGTNDDVEIQAAINALPEDGGEIKILDGTYNLSQGLVFPYHYPEPTAYVHILGCGISTILNFQSTNLKSTVSTGSSASISNISGVNFVLNIAAVGEILIIKDCRFHNSFFYGGLTNNVQITGSVFFVTETQPSGIYSIVDVYGGQTNTGNPYYGICANNAFHIIGNTSLQSAIEGGGAVITNNLVYFSANNSRYGINAGAGSSVSGNTLYNCGITGDNCAVSGNRLSSGNISTTSSSMSGNSIENGYIRCSEASSVSGNTIMQESPIGDACIIVGKTRPNASTTAFPVISGNSCDGGTVGILLRTNSYSNRAESHAVVTGNACSSSVPLKIEDVWSDCLITGNMFPNGAIVDNGTNNTKTNNFTGT